MKDQTLGAPCYKTMGHAAHTVKIEWVISHFDGAMAQGAVLTETLVLLKHSQVRTYKVSHGNFHSVRTCMISRETSVFTSHPRRRQCILCQDCVPLPVVKAPIRYVKKSGCVTIFQCH